MDEHDDDLEPEVQDGEIESEDFPIFDKDDDDRVAEEGDEPDLDMDPDKSEI